MRLKCIASSSSRNLRRGASARGCDVNVYAAVAAAAAIYFCAWAVARGRAKNEIVIIKREIVELVVYINEWGARVIKIRLEFMNFLGDFENLVI